MAVAEGEGRTSIWSLLVSGYRQLDRGLSGNAHEVMPMIWKAGHCVSNNCSVFLL